jgi:hypothetical protein
MPRAISFWPNPRPATVDAMRGSTAPEFAYRNSDVSVPIESPEVIVAFIDGYHDAFVDGCHAAYEVGSSAHDCHSPPSSTPNTSRWKRCLRGAPRTSGN